MSINYSGLLRLDLTKKAVQLAKKGTLIEDAFIFDNICDNFHPESYREIKSTENPWKIRLDKRHSHFNGSVFEMQSSNSSDALLMNIFCHPNIRKWKGVRDLLNIDFIDEIIFGWKEVRFENEKRHPTEIDMKIGNHLFEAKLTEKDFTKKDLSIVLTYNQVNHVFNINKLMVAENVVSNYQLIRNILAAYAHDCSFTVILDQRRIDLIRQLLNTIAAVKDEELRTKIGFVTWQEIASVCGDDLKKYLENKYF